jgi:hypothetical protein
MQTFSYAIRKNFRLLQNFLRSGFFCLCFQRKKLFYLNCLSLHELRKQIFMQEITNKTSNIIAKGERRRRLGGIAAMLLGGLGGSILIWQDAAPFWRLLLFLPFAYGSFGLFQAKEKT